MFPQLTTLLPLLPLFASQVLAGVYITNPVATSSGTGGQSLSVNWADDGLSPPLSSVSYSSVDLCTGSVNTQYCLQNLAANVNVGQTSSVASLVGAGVGPSGDYYFIRFTSNSLMSTTNTQYPYQAFSARFSLAGMTGSFNTTVWNTLNNLATNSTGSSVTASVSASATTGMTTSRMSSGTVSNAKATVATSSASASSTAKTSAGLSSIPVPEFKAILTSSIAVGVFMSGLAIML